MVDGRWSMVDGKSDRPSSIAEFAGLLPSVLKAACENINLLFSKQMEIKKADFLMII
jgi:hypothetical protein